MTDTLEAQPVVSVAGNSSYDAAVEGEEHPIEIIKRQIMEIFRQNGWAK